MATPGAPPDLPLSPSEHPPRVHPPRRQVQRGGVLRAVPTVSLVYTAPSQGSRAPGALFDLQ